MNKDNTFEFQNRNQISNLNQLKLNNIFNNKSEKKITENVNQNKSNFKPFNYNNKFNLDQDNNNQLNLIRNDYLNFYFNNNQNNRSKFNENSNNYAYNLDQNFSRQNEYKKNLINHNEISLLKYQDLKDLNNQIQNYSNQFNQLRDDDLIPRTTIQNKLLNKINQRLIKINNEANDNIYQDNISSQWQQEYMLYQLDNPKLMYLYNNLENLNEINENHSIQNIGNINFNNYDIDEQ
jgi:hypothetical protein